MKRTYDDNVYTDFCGLNVSECTFFTIISIDSLLFFTKNKYYL